MDAKPAQPVVPPTGRPPRATGVRRLQLFIANGFGSGLAPVAPGTFGTAGAVIAFLPLAPLAIHHPVLYAITLLGFLMIAVWASEGAEAHYRRHDVGNIVVDEFLGFFVTMFLLPVTWQVLLLAFVVFRFLDIVKIPPAKQIDRQWPGGWGVVLDDVVSGVYANVVLQVAVRVAPGLLGIAA